MPASKIDPATETWLTYREVCALVQKGKSQLWADVAQGRFPPPVMFGPRKARWPHSVVVKELEQLVSGYERKLAAQEKRRRAA